MPEIFNLMYSIDYKMNIVYTLLQDILYMWGKLFRGLTQNYILVFTYEIPFSKYEILRTIFFLSQKYNLQSFFLILYLKDIKNTKSIYFIRFGSMLY